MKIFFLLSSLFFVSTCFSQDPQKILGKWYACGWIDSLEKINVQQFVKKEPGRDSCKDDHCSISTWEFREDAFYHVSSNGCPGGSVGFGTIGSPLSWSMNDSLKKLTISLEKQKKVIFDIIRLTDTELIVQLVKNH